MVLRQQPNDDIVYRADGVPEHHYRGLPRMRADLWETMTDEQKRTWRALVESYREQIADEDRRRRGKRFGF